MKNKLTIITALTLLTHFSAAHAGIAHMAGKWNGNGAVFTLDGEKLADYGVDLNNTLESDGTLSGVVTVTFSDNSTKIIQQTIRDTDHGFTVESDSGSGGATCVGEGLCEGYFGDKDGNGVAVTVVADGTDQLRMLKTELKEFRATRLFREKYARTGSK